MVKLVLHIGQHKTGSSSIQATFQKAQNQGVFKRTRYLNAPYRNHSAVVGQAFGSRENLKYYRSIKGGHGLPMKSGVDSAKELIADEIADCKAKNLTLVISAEDFVTLHPNEVRSMRGWFEENDASHIQIIGYIRPVEAWASSFAGQLVRQGNKTMGEVVNNPPHPQYREFFQKYLDNFDDVQIIPFSINSLRNGSVVHDFWKRSSIEGEPDEQRENDALTLAQLRLASKMTRLCRENDWHGRRKLSRFLPLIDEQEKKRRKWALPRISLDRAQVAAKEDVAWAVETLGIESAFLEKSSADADPEDLFGEATIDGVAELMMRLVRQSTKE